MLGKDFSAWLPWVITLLPVCPHTQALEGSPKLSLVLQGELWWNGAWWSLSLEEYSII